MLLMEIVVIVLGFLFLVFVFSFYALYQSRGSLSPDSSKLIFHLLFIFFSLCFASAIIFLYFDAIFGAFYDRNIGEFASKPRWHRGVILLPVVAVLFSLVCVMMSYLWYQFPLFIP